MNVRAAAWACKQGGNKDQARLSKSWCPTMENQLKMNMETEISRSL